MLVAWDCVSLITNLNEQIPHSPLLPQVLGKQTLPLGLRDLGLEAVDLSPEPGDHGVLGQAATAAAEVAAGGGWREELRTGGDEGLVLGPGAEID